MPLRIAKGGKRTDDGAASHSQQSSEAAVRYVRQDRLCCAKVGQGCRVSQWRTTRRRKLAIPTAHHSARSSNGITHSRDLYVGASEIVLAIWLWDGAARCHMNES